MNVHYSGGPRTSTHVFHDARSQSCHPLWSGATSILPCPSHTSLIGLTTFLVSHKLVTPCS